MTDDQAVQLLRAIRAHSGLELQSIRDAGDHGADAGWGGFTYYGDTVEFYERNEKLLWALLAEDAEEFGFDSVPAFVASFAQSRLADDETGFGVERIFKKTRGTWSTWWRSSAEAA